MEQSIVSKAQILCLHFKNRATSLFVSPQYSNVCTHQCLAWESFQNLNVRVHRKKWFMQKEKQVPRAIRNGTKSHQHKNIKDITIYNIASGKTRCGSYYSTPALLTENTAELLISIQFRLTQLIRNGLLSALGRAVRWTGGRAPSKRRSYQWID